MMYDALAYARQISKIKDKYRQRGQSLSGAEFLSGMTKEDRLIPVVTLVMYWGQDTWDALCSLYEMLEPVDNKVLSCINDYQINLINPHQMGEEDFGKLGGSLSVVMRFIKASVDKKVMGELLQRFKEDYSKLEQEAVEVIQACTNVVITVDEKGKVVDMCKAWDDHWEDGRKEGLNQGLERGTATQMLVSITAIMKSMKLSLEEACNALNIKKTEYEKAKSIVERL